MRRLFFILAAMLVSGAAMLGQPRNPYYERGYKADLQVGVSPARNYIVANSTLTTSHGYCFGNGLFVGGGTGVYVDRRGIDMKKARILLPIYGEVTYSFMNRMASPLIGVRGGALSDYTIRGAGFFVRPYIGVNIWRMTLTAGIEYLSMGYRTEVYTVGENVSDRTVTGHGGMHTGNIGMHIGISYNF